MHKTQNYHFGNPGRQRKFSWTMVMKIHWETIYLPQICDTYPCYLHLCGVLCANIRSMIFCTVVAHFKSLCIQYWYIYSVDQQDLLSATGILVTSFCNFALDGSFSGCRARVILIWEYIHLQYLSKIICSKGIFYEHDTIMKSFGIYVIVLEM